MRRTPLPTPFPYTTLFRSDEPGPEELPERGEDRGAVERDAARDLLDERRPPHLELSQDSLLVLAERRLGGRFSEPPEVVPERDADAAQAALEWRPHEVAGEAELVEPRGLVAFEARRQQLLLPELHRVILALEGLERLEQAGWPDQAVIGMDVLAPQDERGETLRRGDGADDPARVRLPALDLVEHGDVDVEAVGKLAERAPGEGGVEGAGDGDLGHVIPAGQFRGRDGAAGTDGAEQDPLERRGVGGAPPELPRARLQLPRGEPGADRGVHRHLDR